MKRTKMSPTPTQTSELLCRFVEKRSTKRHKSLVVVVAAVALVGGACGGGGSGGDFGVKRVGTNLVLKNGKGPLAAAAPGAAGAAEALALLDPELALSGSADRIARIRRSLKHNNLEACPKAPSDERPAKAASAGIDHAPAPGTYVYGNTGTIARTVASTAPVKAGYPELSTVVIGKAKPYVKPAVTRPANETEAASRAEAAKRGVGLPPTPTVPPVTVPDVELPDVPVTAPPLPVNVPDPGLGLTRTEPFDKFSFTMASTLGEVTSEVTWAVVGNKIQGISTTYALRSGGIVLARTVLRSGSSYSAFEPTPELFLIPLPLSPTPQSSANVERNLSAPQQTPGHSVVGIPIVQPMDIPYPPGVKPGPVRYEEILAPYTPALDELLGRPTAEDWSVNTAADGFGTTTVVQTRVFDREAIDVCGTMIDTWKIAVVETTRRTDPVDADKTYETHSASVYWIATQFGGLIVKHDLTSVSYHSQTKADGTRVPVTLAVTRSAVLRSAEPLAKAP